MAAITTRQPAIQIEFESRCKKITKEFTGEEISVARKPCAAKPAADYASLGSDRT